MTPFGARLRQIREARGITQARMAADLGVSAAYLSAMEHGRRARPTAGLVRQICSYFGLIWDDADEMMALALRSVPRVIVDTAGLSPRATELANLLADRIRTLPETVIEEVIMTIESAPAD
jgi:transcriptional regulator with XRE-family HTH domain